MKSQKLNIAALIAAIDSEAQSDILDGIYDYAKEHNCNVSAFISFSNTDSNQKHNIGESAIYELPDFQMYDGVIASLNTIAHPETRYKLVEKLSALDKPVVSVDYPMDSAYNFVSDNYYSMVELIEHFILHHKFTRLNFITGPSTNTESNMRLKAYRDTLEKHGIAYEEQRIFYGNFYIFDGRLAIEQFKKATVEFPEVIICSNDIAALSVCSELKQLGYLVPQDICVSGYDYIYEGRNNYPSLTTIKRNYYAMGQSACKKVLAALRGETVVKDETISTELILGESCGCKCVTMDGLNEFRKINSDSYIQDRIILGDMLDLTAEFNECDNLNVFLSTMKKYILRIETKEFYFCLNTDMFIEDGDSHNLELLMNSEAVNGIPYTDLIQVPIAYKNGQFYDYLDYPKQQVFPDLNTPLDEPHLYIFMPVHYRNRTFGYMIFVDSHFPCINPLFINWVINIGNSLESVRKQILLRAAVNRLDNMYVRDPLTLIYNRFGLERFYQLLKENCLIDKQKIGVLFIDMDHMKYINDDFGHKAGDMAICAVANVLREIGEGKFITSRYGGDEFVVLGAIDSKQQIHDFGSELISRLSDYNKTKKFPFHLSVTFGYSVIAVTKDTQLEECIQSADTMMYVNKQHRSKS